MKKNIAVYPGSFDPITKGHIDIVKRALNVFDEIHIAVLANNSKKPCFSTQERVELIKKCIGKLKTVKVESFTGLLADYMRAKKIKTAIRGLRAASDLEYEFQLAHTNRALIKGMETVFFMPSSEYVYLSSSTVREVAAFGGDVSEFVALPVARALKDKFFK